MAEDWKPGSNVLRFLPAHAADFLLCLNFIHEEVVGVTLCRQLHVDDIVNAAVFSVFGLPLKLDPEATRRLEAHLNHLFSEHVGHLALSSLPSV